MSGVEGNSHRDLLHAADVLDEQEHHALLLFVEPGLVRVEEFEQPFML